MLLTASACLQIMQLPGWQRCAVVLGGDLFFIACCIGFLYLAEAYGRQRHGKTARYPGGALLLTGIFSKQMTHSIYIWFQPTCADPCCKNLLLLSLALCSSDFSLWDGLPAGRGAACPPKTALQLAHPSRRHHLQVF